MKKDEDMAGVRASRREIRIQPLILRAAHIVAASSVPPMLPQGLLGLQRDLSVFTEQ